MDRLNRLTMFFILRPFLAITCVSAFVPPNIGNGKAFLPQNEASLGSNIVAQPRTNSVSLSAVLEAGMDPMFTTIVLGAALMASMTLNPDDEDEAISSSAKSLIAESPPEKKETAVEKTVEGTKTAVAVAVAAPPEKKEVAIENSKEVVAEAVVQSDQKMVSEALKKVIAEANARRIIEKATDPVPPAEEELNLESEAATEVPQKEALVAKGEGKEKVAAALEEEVEVAATLEEVTPAPEPVKIVSEVSTDPVDHLANRSTVVIEQKYEIKLNEPKSEFSVSPKEIDIIITHFSSEKSNSCPKALSAPEVQAPTSTPLLVKFVTKVVMPWKKFSTI